MTSDNAYIAGKLKIIAAIEDPAIIVKILKQGVTDTSTTEEASALWGYLRFKLIK